MSRDFDLRGNYGPQNERRFHFLRRVKAPVENLPGLCAIPDCGRPTMRAAGVGLAAFHCRYHVQFRARHGSHWCPTYKSADLKPYLKVAAEWIEQRREETFIAHPLMDLQGLLEGAGESAPAQDIKHRSADFRARMAFARLREANIRSERLLAIHMAVSALIEDDAASHRIEEFRIVQVAKAVHRLASGTHRRWDWPLPDGSLYPLKYDAYPKSSGRVLRLIGKAIEEICAEVTERDLQALRDVKRTKFGPHPSRLTGWRPHWARRREAALKQMSD